MVDSTTQEQDTLPATDGADGGVAVEEELD